MAPHLGKVFYIDSPINLTGRMTLQQITDALQKSLDVDLNSVAFEMTQGESQESFLIKLGLALYECRSISIGKVFNKFKFGLKNFTAFIQTIRYQTHLSLEGMGIGVNQNEFKSKIVSLPFYSLNLSQNHLAFLAVETWHDLSAKLELVKALSLTKNQLSSLSGVQMAAFVKLISTKEYVDLNENEFETCSDHQWQLFCNELIEQRTNVLLEPLKNLSTLRQDQLNKILKKNAFLHSLMATVKLNLWQKERTPIEEKRVDSDQTFLMPSLFLSKK